MPYLETPCLENSSNPFFLKGLCVYVLWGFRQADYTVPYAVERGSWLSAAAGGAVSLSALRRANADVWRSELEPFFFRHIYIYI